MLVTIGAGAPQGFRGFTSLNQYCPLPVTFYRRPAEDVAPELLGRFVVRRVDGIRLVARIVETEAYLGAPDRASHAWAGRRTPRNEALYKGSGVAYVYFIYGLHYCLNAVTGESSDGGAVLIRAAEPLAGLVEMTKNRGLDRSPRPGDLTGGPGKLCQALRIDKSFSGRSLQDGSLALTWGEPEDRSNVTAGKRIGIDYAEEAVDWPLRFAVTGNRHVSKPFPWSRSK